MRKNTNFLINKVIRVTKNNAYYFDKEGICRVIPVKEAIDRKLYGFFESTERGNYYFHTWYTYLPPLSNENQTILRMAIARLKEGDTIDTFYNYLKTVKPVKHPKAEGLDRFLSKFEKPVFIRKPENENLKTFDYIHLDISVLHEWETDRIQYISDNISEIKKRVINYLSNSKIFQKYGIPVKCLRITNVTLTREDFLHFVFELKEF